MFVASDEATAGSVMQNAERISAERSGSSHCRCCASVPYITSSSMLPVSGALQLKTCGAMNDRPMTSASGAYSVFVRPGPYDGSVRNRFHNPAARALACSSARTGSGCQGSSAADSACW